MPFRKTLAATAAIGLVTAPLAAQAAPVRTGTPVAQQERLAGDDMTAAWIGLAAFLVVMAIIAIKTADDDDDDFPVSP